MSVAPFKSTLSAEARQDGNSGLSVSRDENTADFNINRFIQYLAEAVLVVNTDGVIECANAKAALLLNSIERPLLGESWTDFLHDRCVAQYQGLVKIVAKQVLSLQTGPTEMVIRCANGELKDIELSVSFLSEPEARLLLILRDLTHQKAEFEQLRRQAATDALTGLANRRSFDEQLLHHWLQCTAAKRPLSVIIIDIDFFKQFNDSYGHIQGDACLRKVARAILQAMPLDAQLAARYGGEEFALILPNYNEIKALAVAREVQQAVRQLQFTDAALPASVGITVSQGIASEINGQFRTSTALLCAADTALYRAKADGRDCINTSC